MAFVKLDCGILNSTLWLDRTARDIFITALLMAEPFELTKPAGQIMVGSLKMSGWEVPTGWYGFVPAASVGIIHRAGVDQADGMKALARLGAPEESSRSHDFDGRRLVRIDGGFVVLNYFKYRDRDHTAAERQARLRARRKSNGVTQESNGVTQRDEAVTSRIAEEDADADVEAHADAEAEKPPPSPSKGATVAIPSALDTSEFRAAWEAWQAERKERGIKAYGSRGLALALKKLAAMGAERAVAAIEHSLAGGYQGIFEARAVAAKPDVAEQNETNIKRWLEDEARERGEA